MAKDKAAHGGRHSLKIRTKNTRHHVKLRAAVLAYLGHKCTVCGFTDARALQVDHIYGGGVKELRHGHKTRQKSAYAIYREIIAGKREGEFQLLCANHNWIKRVERGEVRA